MLCSRAHRMDRRVTRSPKLPYSQQEWGPSLDMLLNAMQPPSPKQSVHQRVREWQGGGGGESGAPTLAKLQQSLEGGRTPPPENGHAVYLLPTVASCTSLGISPTSQNTTRQPPQNKPPAQFPISWGPGYQLVNLKIVCTK